MTTADATLADIAKETFGALNVMILVRKSRAIDKPGQAGTRLFGNPDDSFLQSRPKRGLLTPAEVRSLAPQLMEVVVRMGGPEPDFYPW